MSCCLVGVEREEREEGGAKRERKGRGKRLESRLDLCKSLFLDGDALILKLSSSFLLPDLPGSSAETSTASHHKQEEGDCWMELGVEEGERGNSMPYFFFLFFATEQNKVSHKKVFAFFSKFL